MQTTVIIPVLNGANTIDRALNSILRQTHPVDQVVIVNDGSTDLTAECVAGWRDRLPILDVANSENKGIIYSLRRGVDESTGDLIFRLDADDAWLPDHCERLVNLASNDSGASLFAARTSLTSFEGIEVGLSAKISEGDIRARLMWDNPIIHSSVAFRRTAYDFAGGYRGPKYAEDYDLWIRLVGYGSFSFSAVPSVQYFISPFSASRIKRDQALSIRANLQLFAIKQFRVLSPVRAVVIFSIVWTRKIFLGLSSQ